MIEHAEDPDRAVSSSLVQVGAVEEEGALAGLHLLPVPVVVVQVEHTWKLAALLSNCCISLAPE